MGQKDEPGGFATAPTRCPAEEVQHWLSLRIGVHQLAEGVPDHSPHGDDDFPGASNRRDSREERIQRLMLEAIGSTRETYPAGKVRIR
jgi:hypothetical protein